MTPHIHRDLIIAWANGAEIQVHMSWRGGWVDCVHHDGPAWTWGATYRLKPKPVTVRYRVALMRSVDMSPMTNTADTAEQERSITASGRLVRWLADWQEVEV